MDEMKSYAGWVFPLEESENGFQQLNLDHFRFTQEESSLMLSDPRKLTERKMSS